GLLRDFYLPRWKHFFDHIAQTKALPVGFDYFDMEREWTMKNNNYPTRPSTDAIRMAQGVNEFLKRE
ncbi:MAG: alpha-N-acetylglucosaminidase C-terminal domain-containing protein, partial [Mucinivorans sp.]